VLGFDQKTVEKYLSFRFKYFTKQNVMILVTDVL